MNDCGWLCLFPIFVTCLLIGLWLDAVNECERQAIEQFRLRMIRNGIKTTEVRYDI